MLHSSPALAATRLALAVSLACAVMLAGCGGAAGTEGVSEPLSGTPNASAEGSGSADTTGAVASAATGAATAAAVTSSAPAASAISTATETDPLFNATVAAKTAADLQAMTDTITATQAAEASSAASDALDVQSQGVARARIVLPAPAPVAAAPASQPLASSPVTASPVAAVPGTTSTTVPPVATTPVTTTPVAATPVATTPVTTTPVATTPVTTTPVATTPVTTTPVTTTPVATSPGTPPPVATAPVSTSPGSLLWSDPATWNGALPPAKADVVIPAGKTVVLDVGSVVLGALKIEGTLKFADKDIQLTAASIDVTGALNIGSAAQPYVNKATITLNGQPLAINDGVARGLLVHGGTLNFYGVAPSPAWTRLNDHAAAGTKSLTMADAVNWQAGDSIVVGPTDFYGINPTERFTVVGASGKRVDTDAGIAKFRWGKLQYMTDKGLALTPDPAYAPPVLPAPTVLDERAAVGNLSRNIVVQGADDDAWRTKGFGAHLMVMDLKSRVVIDGAEFRRVGQAGITGRYPVHFHMLSYGADGVLLGDASTIAVRNSAIWGSVNRCLVLHGTNGVTVSNNICEDIKGHAFFLEDAVERRNVFSNNLALVIHNQPAATRLQVHEGDVGDAGASGFWITNPDNVLTGNLAADAQGNGIWMAFPYSPLGLSKKVAIKPSYLLHGTFENNTVNSNYRPGMLMQQDPCDAAGNLCLTFYIPTIDDGAHEGANAGGDPAYRRTVELKRTTLFKNGDGAYRNRVKNAVYSEWVVADNPGTNLAGSAWGRIERALFVGNSLNNGTQAPSFNKAPAAAFSTYDQRVTDSGNVIYNFPFVDGQPSGMFNMQDYYLMPIIKATALNADNRLIGSSPGYRVLSPNLWSTPNSGRANYALAGAIWDPWGLAGPKNNWWVYDVPFLTTGASCVPVPPAGKNGASCDGEYYGVEQFTTDFSADGYNPLMPIDVQRVDDKGAAIGAWSVPDGKTSERLGNMRHFAAHKGGAYILRMPGSPLPKSIAMMVRNGYRADDTFLMAVGFDGGKTPSGYVAAGADGAPQSAATWSGNLAKSVRWFKPAASLEDVKAGAGDLMWQDKANNLVWIRFKGGLPYSVGDSSIPKNSFMDLYRTYALVINSK